MKDPKYADTDFSAPRVCFPEDERRHEWLPMLLDAYAIVDAGVRAAIAKREKAHGVKLACREGCTACCFQPDIPVYPLEVVGIYWYAAEKVADPARKAVKEKLLFHTPKGACPFLLDGSCSIHAVRPVSCRQFNVFGEPCAPGEDPYFTRRGDVLTPSRESTVRAFEATLPFYGGGEASPEAVDRIINAEARNLKSLDWKKLYRVMEGFNP